MKLSKKLTKIIAITVATVIGFCVIDVASALIAYKICARRYERPDYLIYAGNYYYERIKERLPREEFNFYSGENVLQGYFYEAENAKGIVVLAHGYRSGADEYLPMIEYFVNSGYSVFTYNCTGTYESEGDDMIGMCQALVDIDNALTYIKTTPPYDNQPLFLIGHSWGGYAATSVLALQTDINACAAIAPMNNGYTVMLETAEQYVGALAYVAAPVFNTYQNIVFDDYVNYSGVAGINSVDIPVFIAQGLNDTVITYDGQSITAHKDEITNPNVIYYKTEGLLGDHNNIWHSINSIAYQSEVKAALNLLETEKGSPLTYEEKVDFYKTVDHDLYSEVNKELLNEIIKTFDSTLNN